MAWSKIRGRAGPRWWLWPSFPAFIVAKTNARHPYDDCDASIRGSAAGPRRWLRPSFPRLLVAQNQLRGTPTMTAMQAFEEAPPDRGGGCARLFHLSLGQNPKLAGNGDRS